MSEQNNKLAPVERFTNSVVSCYSSGNNTLMPSPQEVKCIQGYFWNIDLMLKNSKDGYNWSMVKMQELAPRLKHYARVGLDMNLPNQLFPVAYKDGKNPGKIDIVLTQGYNGYKHIALKFAAKEVKDIIVHLVGENDTFKAIYKDANHSNDNYIFEENTFEKGDIRGGFAYVVYEDETLNKLVTMSADEIKKHMPSRGSSFWTGPWKYKMWEKTLCIAATKTIAIDSDKIREYEMDIAQIQASELNDAKIVADAEANEKMSSKEVLDVDFEEVEQEPDRKDDEEIFA